MVQVARDGSTWRIGTDADVAWITSAISTDLTITSAIPPVFAAYATVLPPERGEGEDAHDQAVLGLLGDQSADQLWWLGYLDTGADDIVFPDAPMVRWYPGWRYVLVQAGSPAGRHLAEAQPFVILERHLAQPDVPRRPLVAGVDAVGRRLDLHRRSGRARGKLRAPSPSAS